MAHRILLVDDHEVLRKGIRTLLNKDWEVCGEAANGQEAVEKTLQLKPDIVLMDVSMPVMNGIEATKSIRQAGSAAKIVILSMHDSSQLAKEAKLAGADACLKKTCSVQDLLGTLSAALK